MSEPGTLAIGIGAQKGGTTSVWQALQAQPWFDPATAKELNYFSRRFGLGDDWYRAQLPTPRHGRVRGEVSVSYLTHPAAPERIQAFDPNARLFVVLRDPVERAISAHLHGSRDGWPGVSGTIEDVLSGAEASWTADRLPRSLADGCYHRDLSRYFEHLEPERLHVLFLEELVADPEGQLRALFLHLGAPPASIVSPLELPHANAYRSALFPRLQRALVVGARRSAHRGRMRTSRRLLRAEAFLGLRDGSVERPEVPASTRAALREFYAEADVALARLLGRPLPW